MLTTIIIILVVLWLFGVLANYTLGGLIHILLILAIIGVIIRLLRGEDPF